MITLSSNLSTGVVQAIGETRFDPTEHVLCEGSKDDVLAVLVSIHGWRPSTGAVLGRMLRRQVVR